MAAEGELFWSNEHFFFGIKWKDLFLVLPWETLQTICGPMEIKSQFEYSKTQLPMTTTKGQPQPHIMHLHVNPNSGAYDNYWRTTTTPHHAFTCTPKRHGLKQKLLLQFLKDLKSDQKEVPPISVFRCYLKVFGKMVTEIIILYRKLSFRGTSWPPFAASRLISSWSNVERKPSLHLTENLSDRCGQWYKGFTWIMSCIT